MQKLLVVSKLGIVLVALLASANLFAGDSKGPRPSCREILQLVVDSDFGQATGEYLRDLVRTGGGRFVLAPATEKAATKGFGLLTYEKIENKPTDNWLQKTEYYFAHALPLMIGRALAREEDYRFTPIRFVTEPLVHRPIEAATGKVFGKRRTPSIPARMGAFGLAFFWGLGMFMDYAGDRARAKAPEVNQLDIQMNESEYKNLVSYDFRYREARMQPTEAQAVEVAQSISLAYRAYYRIRDTMGLPETLHEQMELYSGNALFRDIVAAYTQPLESNPMIHAHQPGVVSDQQALDLMFLQHAYLAKLQYLESAFHNQSALYRSGEKRERDPNSIHQLVFGSDVIRMLKPYFKGALNSDRPQDHLAELQMYTSMIQEYLFYELLFQRYKVLKQSPKRVSAEPYSLENEWTWESKREDLLKKFLARIR